MSSESIEAIDVHGHYGRYDCGSEGLVNEFMSGDAPLVAARARQANIRLTLVSPLQALLPRGRGDAVAGNRHAARIVGEIPGLAHYVVIDPRCPETYRQADEMLPRPRCAGIKIHPEEHLYPIREFGAGIFEFAARHRAVVMSHSNDQNSLASELVEWADRFPELTLILAHLGWGWDGDYTHQVRGVQRSRQGNVFTDTSSARSITPGLLEWAVREIGSDRILFGTDTPLYLAAMQRVRIDRAELTDAEKSRILHENAERVFGPRLVVDCCPVAPIPGELA